MSRRTAEGDGTLGTYPVITNGRRRKVCSCVAEIVNIILPFGSQDVGWLQATSSRKPDLAVNQAGFPNPVSPFAKIVFGRIWRSESASQFA